MKAIKREDVEHVLTFWFGKGGKDRWFESNPEKRSAIDKDIQKRFGDLLISIETTDSNFENEDIETRVCAIIVLDQFSRHIFRNASLQGMVLIRQNTERAAEISLNIINQKCEMTGSYLEYLPFILMPLKHHNLCVHWQIIKDELYRCNYTQHLMLYRFYKDTIKKVAIKNNDNIGPTTMDTKGSFDFELITDFLPKGKYLIFEYQCKLIFKLNRVLLY